MLYFVRRSFNLDNDKALHKKQLRKSVYTALSDGLKSYGIDLSESSVSYNKYGKPFLKDSKNLDFNISHCRELAVCAIEKTEVGVDAEDIRKLRPGVIRRAFSEKEKYILENSADSDQMFFRIWTLKESFVKALGIGISYPLKSAEFLINDDIIMSVGCDGYSFTQIIVNQKFVCSLCLKKTAENKFFRVHTDKDFFTYKI